MNKVDVDHSGTVDYKELAASLIDWGDPMIRHFDLVVYLSAPAEIRVGAPLLGEHNDEILSETGLSEAEIGQFRASGAIGAEQQARAADMSAADD